MKTIPLTKGYVAVVDDEDYEELIQYKWHVCLMSGGARAIRTASRPRRRTTYMHRSIIGCQPSQEVDHINHDGLDNRRANLRACTHAQNLANTRKRANCSSQFKGVDWRKGENKWRVRIGYDGASHHLGYFDDECDAARAYNAEARIKFGEFALLNVIEEAEDASDQYRQRLRD